MQKKLKNIGPVSWRAFRRAGIHDVETLRNMGAVAAYVLVEQNEAKNGRKVSLNLLYALAAGLSDRHWCALDAAEKGRLLREVADLKESHSRAAT